jgi:acetolactate decarboxylase
MKPVFALFALILVASAFAGCTPGKADRDMLFQTTPFITLNNGYFDGDVPLSTLKKHGDFGLGTFDALNGEMIILGDQIYQVKSDGKVYPADDKWLTPFAEVTYLDEDIKIDIGSIGNFEALQKFIDNKLPTLNTIYAIQLKGTFPWVKTRSVPPFKKPYPTLTEAVKSQSVFELNNVSGTIVGFRAPAYIGSLNVAGYHFHFITDDRKAGGHLLDLKFDKATAIIDDTGYYYMEIPSNSEINRANLNPGGSGAE